MGFQHMKPEKRSAAARKGGATNKKRQLARDPEHFAKIGLKGGLKVKEERGVEYYRELGHMRPGERRKI